MEMQAGTADGRALRYHSSNPEMLQSFMTSQPVAESAKPPRKRKRTSESAKAQTAVPASTSESNWQHQQQQHQQRPPDMDTLMQAQIARDDPSISHTQGPPPEGKRQKQESIISQEDTTRGGNPAPTEVPIRETQPPQQAWTAANNPPPNPTAPQPINYIRQMYQPPIQSAPPPAAPPPQPAPPQNVRQSSSVPLDNLSRQKQEHVLGLLSGLQGNINNLQSQLNILKQALGIDLDDSGSTH